MDELEHDDIQVSINILYRSIEICEYTLRNYKQQYNEIVSNMLKLNNNALDDMKNKYPEYFI